MEVRRVHRDSWDALPRALQVMSTTEFAEDATRFRQFAYDVLEYVKDVFYRHRIKENKPRYEIIGQGAEARIIRKEPLARGRGLEKGFRVYSTNVSISNRKVKFQSADASDIVTANKVDPTAGRFGFTVQHAQANNPKTAKVLRVLDRGLAATYSMSLAGKQAFRYIRMRKGEPELAFARGRFEIHKSRFDPPMEWMRKTSRYVAEESRRRVLLGAQMYATYFNNSLRAGGQKISRYEIEDLSTRGAIRSMASAQPMLPTPVIPRSR